jgi:hypothetical protein
MNGISTRKYKAILPELAETVGVSNGTGMMYFDDIRLYPPAP